MTLLTVLAALLLLASLRMLAHMAEAKRELPLAGEWQPDEEPREWPSVSIVITARDEELHLEQAARTLLALDYEPLQLVAVNDRSDDATGEILDRLAAEDPRLKVVHIGELPDGWLGKNHAIQRAAEQADGEYLLLTDADVFMDSQTLHRGVGYARQHRVDHLAMLPECEVRGFWLQTFINTFAVMFSVYFRPWRTRREGSPQFVGIGAFNLIRREAFEQIEGMAPIRMRPDDDLMLGKLVKKHGLRQDVISGVGMVKVPWYESLGEAIRGLEKNAFAAAEYSLLRVAFMTSAALAVFVGPWVGAALAPSPARWVFVAAVLAQLVISVGSAVTIRYSPLVGVAFPLGVILMVYTQLRATWLTFLRGGIRWRGTHYSLSELKANRV